MLFTNGKLRYLKFQISSLSLCVWNALNWSIIIISVLYCLMFQTFIVVIKASYLCNISVHQKCHEVFTLTTQHLVLRITASIMKYNNNNNNTIQQLSQNCFQFTYYISLKIQYCTSLVYNVISIKLGIH